MATFEIKRMEYIRGVMWLLKAEEIARESLRIRTLINDSKNNAVELSCDLLARILSAQGKLADETKGLYERSLAISIRKIGPDGEYAAFGNKNIGEFHQKLARNQSTVDAKRTHLLLVKSHHEEAQRIYSKIHGLTHPSTVDAASRMTSTLIALSQL
jgi:hypothetical protein